jgi:hypothetical protein
MTVEEGIVEGRSTGAFRHFARIGCGSNPRICGFSKLTGGVLANIVKCQLTESDEPVKVIDSESRQETKEVINDINCGVVS